MPNGFLANVYQVFIASPGDVTEERECVRRILYQWNALNSEYEHKVLLPLSWETHSHSSMGEHPQTTLNKQILKNADLLIAVFGTRLGTQTQRYESGTVEEIEEHLKADKPAMLYFYGGNISQSTNGEQWDAVQAIKNKHKEKGYYKEYKSIEDFEKILLQDISLMVRELYFNATSQSAISGKVIPTPKLKTTLQSGTQRGEQIKLQSVILTGIDFDEIQNYGVGIPNAFSHLINRGYYKKCFNYCFERSILRPIHFRLENFGNSLINNVKVELSTNTVICKNDLSDMPEKQNALMPVANWKVPSIGDGSVSITGEESPFTLEIDFRRIRAGETIQSDTFYISPASPEDNRRVVFRGNLFADELDNAISVELQADFNVMEKEIKINDFLDIADTENFDSILCTDDKNHIS